MNYIKIIPQLNLYLYDYIHIIIYLSHNTSMMLCICKLEKIYEHFFNTHVHLLLNDKINIINDILLDKILLLQTHYKIV